MPFIFRDPDTKAILRATTRPVPSAEFVPHGHPELVVFLNERGIDIKQIDDALNELKRTDLDMSRAVEDLITALLRKNIIKINDLPRVVQDRIALRTRMRLLISESYERASASKPVA